MAFEFQSWIWKGPLFSHAHTLNVLTANGSRTPGCTVLTTKFSVCLSNFPWKSMILVNFWARWRHQNRYRYKWNIAEHLRNHENVFAFHIILRWNWHPMKTRTSTLHTLYTMRCRYNAVNSLANVHRRHPIAGPLRHICVTRPQWVKVTLYHVYKITKNKVSNYFVLMLNNMIIASET